MKFPFKDAFSKKPDTNQESDPLRLAAQAIASRRPVVALTGAGISVDSGIPDFRGSGGLWERYDPMEVAHIEAFHETPEKVWSLFYELYDLLDRADPNPGHLGLGSLEALGCLKTVITQNVDGLHQRAGNTDVVEYHGNNRALSCLRCNLSYEKQEVLGQGGASPPRCECEAILKPDMTFFGEPIHTETQLRAQTAAQECRVMLVVGTSALVYPAASMPSLAKSNGALIIEINLQETPLTGTITDIFLPGSTTHVFPRLVDAVQGILDRENEFGFPESTGFSYSKKEIQS